MTTTIQDLWPAEFSDEGMTPPVTILRQQATILGQKTKNLVEGDVQTTGLPEGLFSHVFKLVAPAMDDFKYCLFVVTHQVAFYPLNLRTCGYDIIKECNSEAEYLDALQTIFAEEETRKVISALIAQSKA